MERRNDNFFEVTQNIADFMHDEKRDFTMRELAMLYRFEKLIKSKKYPRGLSTDDILDNAYVVVFE